MLVKSREYSDEILKSLKCVIEYHHRTHILKKKQPAPAPAIAKITKMTKKKN